LIFYQLYDNFFVIAAEHRSLQICTKHLDSEKILYISLSRHQTVQLFFAKHLNYVFIVLVSLYNPFNYKSINHITT